MTLSITDKYKPRAQWSYWIGRVFFTRPQDVYLILSWKNLSNVIFVDVKMFWGREIFSCHLEVYIFMFAIYDNMEWI